MKHVFRKYSGYCSPCLFAAIVLFGMLANCPSIASSSAFENSVDFGYQLRSRYEDFDNIITYNDTLDDKQQFYRFRSRFWGRLIHHNLELKLQLTNEFRHYQHPDRDFTLDELFVDECYLKVDGLFDSNWFIKAGRQNIIKGDGFLFFDGVPLDGSRAIHYNAIVLGADYSSHAIEFLGISNPHKDTWFPRLNDKNRVMTESDEQAIGACITRRMASNRVVEGTWLYKQESSPHEKGTSMYSPKRAWHTAGARTILPAGTSGTVTAEGAMQFGTEDPDRSIRAWGGYVTWKQPLKQPLNPQLKLSAGALSGDDPDSGRDEGWTPPFSRWPLWSELYIFSFINERGVASWSNLWYAHAECMVSPSEQLKIRLSWYRLGAFHAPAVSSNIFGDGKNRGNLFQLMTEFSLAAGVSGHILYEHHVPGDFYSARDSGHYLRFELIWQVARRFPFGKTA